MKTFDLPGGVKIPATGLGTWNMHGRECEQAVLWALEAGYRHIDTATLYANEAEIGRAIKQSGVPRSEIFVTTKLYPSDFNNPKVAFDQSLERLDTDYVDLYLIHAPRDSANVEVWQDLIKFRDQGRTRTIGVSNYDQDEIETLVKQTGEKPVVNQIKINPWDYPRQLIEHNQKAGIVVEAYTPLTRRARLGDPLLAGLSKKYSKSAAQILIRWCLQHDLVTIPKSSNKGRIRENLEVFDFEIEAADMQRLDSISS